MVKHEYRLFEPSYNVWQADFAPAPLTDGVVDLWRVDLDRDPSVISSLYDLLSDDEKTRVGKFVFASDRENFVVCRGALRTILGGYLDIAPERIRFSTGRYGKPALCAEGRHLGFNVSHSRGIAVIAVSLNREVGVDIEFVDRDFDVFSVASSVFSVAGVSLLTSLPSHLRAATFFAGWTRKEAFLKAIGDGLSSSDGLQSAILSLNEEGLLDRTLMNIDCKDWSLMRLEIHNDFKAFLVVEGSFRSVRFWQLKANSEVYESTRKSWSNVPMPSASAQSFLTFEVLP